MRFKNEIYFVISKFQNVMFSSYSRKKYFFNLVISTWMITTVHRPLLHRVFGLLNVRPLLHRFRKNRFFRRKCPRTISIFSKTNSVVILSSFFSFIFCYSYDFFVSTWHCQVKKIWKKNPEKKIWYWKNFRRKTFLAAPRIIVFCINVDFKNFCNFF